MRERRTVTVDFGLSIAEYSRAHADSAIFIERVTATMRVVTHVRHHDDCSGGHRYTRHSTHGRFLHCKGTGRTRITVSQIRCLECGAVFTVLPSFGALIAGTHLLPVSQPLQNRTRRLAVLDPNFRKSAVSQIVKRQRQRNELAVDAHFFAFCYAEYIILDILTG